MYCLLCVFISLINCMAELAPLWNVTVICRLFSFWTRMCVREYTRISICVKQLWLFQQEQLHGELQDAAVAKGEIGGGGWGASVKKRKKIFFFLFLLNPLGEFSLSPRGVRKRSVFFSPLTCWAVYGGHYLTLIAAWAFVLGLYMPQLNTLLRRRKVIGHSTRLWCYCKFASEFCFVIVWYPFIPLCWTN